MKKIIFGAIFSAFLLLAVQWVAPVNVKAAGTTVTEIKQEMGNLAKQIRDDENFDTIIKDENLKSLLNQVLNDEIDFQTFADAVEATQAFQQLKTNTEEDIDTFLTDMGQITFPKNEVSDDSKYFKISLDNGNKISIKGQDDDEINDGILINENGNVKIPGYGWLDEGDWLDLIGKLVVYLLGATMVVGLLIVILTIVMSVFTFIVGLIESAISALVVFAIALAGVAVVLGLADDIIEFFRSLSEGKSPISKAKNSVLSKYCRLVSIKFKALIEFLLDLLNLEPKTCFA